MKARTRMLATLAMITTLLFVGLGASAEPTTTNTETSVTTEIGQTVNPFTEMLPGIYVASQWWNESGDSYSLYTEPAYYSDSEFNETEGYRYIAEYYVEDIYGNLYTIEENSISNWTSDWEFSNLLVVVVLDPDASYVTWMNEQENIYGLWSVFWWPDQGALSGDEVFIYSSFYYSAFNDSSYYKAEYTWYDDYGIEVNANDVIPNLSVEYEWASYMNETYEYDYDWNYCGYGYDVNEMFRTEDSEQWMQHYFSGLSVFNDTNNNGQMDIVYNEVEYDFNQDGIIDWINYEMNLTASELVYDFYADNADLGDIVMPYVNSDGQIEWSAEVVDITGNLVEYRPYEIWYCDVSPLGYIPEESESIPVNIDSLKLTFRFETTNEAAVIKIDQYVGDFTDPISGLVPVALEGLGLTLNYWSSFSSYSIAGEYSNPTYTDVTSGIVDATTGTVSGGSSGTTTTDVAPTSTTEWIEAPSTTLGSGTVPDGFLRFREETDLRSTIEFGGTYVLGRDGFTYDVGTAVMPMYFYGYSFGLETTSANLAGAMDVSWGWGQTYYYSSCYATWDGYAITHDPIFSVFPMKSPSAASAFIQTLIDSSIVIGVLGAVMTLAVCVRINTERKK
ncbi:MAG: hypothetical protein E4H14_08515 [Candidatus Thorarchaeota archaeon]|nr:MAG: hypothetical protein E4H14_08515 [Candidatus Thorarchaeota archaeon]